MSTKKYKLGEKHPTLNLYRVVALRDFGDVKAGDVGGWVESEKNLSHEGLCWVSGNGRVFESGQVSGNGRVCGDAEITKNEDIIAVAMTPYSVTVTPQNIVIGCQVRSRFGKQQWKKTDPEVTSTLFERYRKTIGALKRLVPRKKSRKACV